MVGNSIEEYTVDEMKESLHQCSPTITELIQQKINIILKEKQMITSEKVNFAQISNFASSFITKSKQNNFVSCWIVDTGVTNHIYAFKKYTYNLKIISQKNHCSFT